MPLWGGRIASVSAAGIGITFRPRGSGSIGARMEILFLISVLVFVAIYAAYREWLNAAHRRWLGELDLYKKRLSAYDELKRAVGPLRGAGQVSQEPPPGPQGQMAVP